MFFFFERFFQVLTDTITTPSVHTTKSRISLADGGNFPPNHDAVGGGLHGSAVQPCRYSYNGTD